MIEIYDDKFYLDKEEQGKQRSKENCKLLFNELMDNDNYQEYKILEDILTYFESYKAMYTLFRNK